MYIRQTRPSYQIKNCLSCFIHRLSIRRTSKHKLNASAHKKSFARLISPMICGDNTYTPPNHTRAHTHTHSHTKTHERTHAHTHTRTHTQTHARTHTQTHTLHQIMLPSISRCDTRETSKQHNQQARPSHGDDGLRWINDNSTAINGRHTDIHIAARGLIYSWHAVDEHNTVTHMFMIECALLLKLKVSLSTIEIFSPVRPFVDTRRQ